MHGSVVMKNYISCYLNFNFIISCRKIIAAGAFISRYFLVILNLYNIIKNHYCPTKNSIKLSEAYS